MKKDIHPNIEPTKFICSCGNQFELLSTKGGTVYIEVCNQCHPYYTGKLKAKPLFIELQGGKAEN